MFLPKKLCLKNQSLKANKTMKASHLKKQSEVIENIYQSISRENQNGNFKHFIPHFVYVSEQVKSELIENGYKVYRGDWDGIITNALIIEW